MELSDIRSVISAKGVGDTNSSVGGIAYRSDAVVPGDVFFCIPGFSADGHDFAADAVERGAVMLVVERELPGVSVEQVLVADARIALAHAADEFWANPSSKLDVVGITGTNGKTTTAYLLDAIVRSDGRKTGLVGTVETVVGDEHIQASRTTPESADLQRLFARMLRAEVETVSMEVSSHAIDLHRVDAVRFAVAAFTNLTQDHLDYHHTIEEYFAVKRRLFTDFDVGGRVVNVDDPLGAAMAMELDDVLSVGMSAEAMLRALNIESAADRTRFHLRFQDQTCEVDLPLAGAYNVSNALVAAGCALSLGVALEQVARGLSIAPQVPGRLERIDSDVPFSVYVDYAHTPDSVHKAASALRATASGRVIVVLGAGGDRDPAKRPLMGAAAGQVADHTIVTSDNPRSEDPVGIILQIEDGLRGVSASYEIEVDRRRAIAKAVGQAVEGDVILIAGKGHEDYQIFAERTIHFDDREVAREELGRLC